MQWGGVGWVRHKTTEEGVRGVKLLDVDLMVHTIQWCMDHHDQLTYL